MATNDVELQRIRRLEEQLAKKKAELVRARGRLSESARKARARKLIQFGELVELAGLFDSDAAFLLGVLLEAADVPPESERWKALRERGKPAIRPQEAAAKRLAKTEV